jgi:hypothetical protein
MVEADKGDFYWSVGTYLSGSPHAGKAMRNLKF